MLSVFVLGNTKSGKTTVGRAVAERMKFRSVSASGWIKARVSASVRADVRLLTQASLDALRVEPDACVRWLQAEHDFDAGGLVIDGIRNPRDFALLFRPERDMVVWLDASWAPRPATPFELHGLGAIQSMLHWSLTEELVPASRVARFFVGPVQGEIPRGVRLVTDLDAVIAKVTDAVASAAACCPPPARHGICTVPLPTIPAWVAERVLYNEAEDRPGWRECRIIAVSSYPGSPLTFQVLLGDGALFSYVPPHRLLVRPPTEVTDHVGLDDLVYRNAPTAPIAVTKHASLAAAPCWVYLRNLGRWLQAEYVATVDWYTENSLDHVLLLENGQIACLPSHKVLFGKAGPLPPYLPLKATWSATTSLEASQTAALVVIQREDRKLLAVSRKDDRTDFGFPGGKLEPDELPEEAAARETWEETGVRVDPMSLRRVYVGRARTGRIAVAFVAAAFDGAPTSKEGAAVAWVSWDVLLRGSFGTYNAALMMALGQGERVR